MHKAQSLASDAAHAACAVAGVDCRRCRRRACEDIHCPVGADKDSAAGATRLTACMHTGPTLHACTPPLQCVHATPMYVCMHAACMHATSTSHACVLPLPCMYTCRAYHAHASIA
eukprot:365023-Chlamydomonas_euryale.AAC.18